MSHSFIRFHDVTFGYDSASEPLFQDISLHIAPGWSGVVGANGTGKTTLLKLATRILETDKGAVQAPLKTVYCPQRTDDMPEQFEEFVAEQSQSALLTKSLLSIQDDWRNRWETLSHGERKRAQIAVALWLEPEVLAIDEPTNHVDAEARKIIITALQIFDGVGLLVSHDRELLDTLCQQCVFIELPDIVIRPGGVTQGMIQAKREQQSAQKQYLLKKHTYKKLKREALKRREKAQQADKKRSKRKISHKDHDAKEKIDRARITSKDAVAGKLLRQLDGRLKHAEKQVEMNQFKKEYALGVWLPGSRSHRDVLLHLPANTLPLGEKKLLSYPELFLKPDDRVALTGPNGTGKSTLIRHIVQVLNVQEEHVTYVPQEIHRYQARDILTQVRMLPHEKLGHLMTIVSRLGSRPHRLLDSVEPSPGETRKLLLALGMIRVPHIIIMDEPTNHMDLPSIECLEQALAECPCCLLLVSHDKHFLDKLAQKQWDIVRDTKTDGTFAMQVIV